MSLEIRELWKSFGAQQVVRGIDLTIARGEIVALLGPSGCGKTTALRMVAGLERPDRGTIAIAGRAVAELPPEKRGVGMVFQSYAVWPHKNVRDNVAYPLVLAKKENPRAAADEVLSLVRLGGMGDRMPETLSGGQQQRVALARALVAKPELLLFDEPLSNLDAKLREEMRYEIRELVRKVGLTALYVTHDQPEAFAVSDRVAVVLGGKIAQIAEPRVLYETPAELDVARFVGRLSVLGKVERASESSVRIAGHEVPATFTARDGSLCAGVRPEDVAISATGIAGRVVRATFLGDRVELAIETEAGELRVDARGGIEVGGNVRVEIARCRCYAAAPS